MSEQQPMRPDERTFRQHIRQGAFLSGAARGRWQLLSVAWPVAVISVRAAPREGAPDVFAFRFDLSGYPIQAPNARPWDAERNEPLSANRWPAGTPGSRVALAFVPRWKDGQALYLPCDRLSIDGHPDWRTKYPEMLWTPEKDVTFYLNIIHDLLDSDHYTGVASA